MGITYMLTESSVIPDGAFRVRTYGITAVDSTGCERVFSQFSDVSLNKDFTKRIVDLLNNYEVELCHFYDVVLDELNR